MTAIYDRSKAGAVILKIPIMVWPDPMPIQFRQIAKATTSQTALTGVCVRWFTLLQNLRQTLAGILSSPGAYYSYAEKGNASSRANAYAILVSASMAEHPVKNWINITQNHMLVPPLRPPAFKKI